MYFERDAPHVCLYPSPLGYKGEGACCGPHSGGYLHSSYSEYKPRWVLMVMVMMLFHRPPITVTTNTKKKHLG